MLVIVNGFIRFANPLGPSVKLVLFGKKFPLLKYGNPGPFGAVSTGAPNGLNKNPHKNLNLVSI